MTNKKSNKKTDEIFKLIMVENLRKSIKGYSALFMYTIQVRYYSHIWYDDVTLINNVVASYWTNDVALTSDVTLTDDVARLCWTEMLMWH